MWYTEYLTVKELYATIADTQFIASLFKKGLKRNNDRLAVSAMEELLRRGDSDMIVYALNDAFASKLMVKGSPLVTLISNSLLENAHEINTILYHYGKGLRRGDFMGPSDWIRTHADWFKRVHCSGDVRRARPWATQYIWTHEEIAREMNRQDAELAYMVKHPLEHTAEEDVRLACAEANLAKKAKAKRKKLSIESFKEFVQNL